MSVSNGLIFLLINKCFRDDSIEETSVLDSGSRTGTQQKTRQNESTPMHVQWNSTSGRIIQDAYRGKPDVRRLTSSSLPPHQLGLSHLSHHSLALFLSRLLLRRLGPWQKRRKPSASFSGGSTEDINATNHEGGAGWWLVCFKWAHLPINKQVFSRRLDRRDISLWIQEVVRARNRKQDKTNLLPCMYSGIRRREG